MFIKNVLKSANSRRFGINPFISRMFQPIGQYQTFTVHARPMMHMLFETCVRARSKINLNLMFMPLGASVLSLKITLLSSRCLGAVPLFTCLTTDTVISIHVLGVVVIGQIKVLGHGKISSLIAGIMIISLHRPKVLA